MAESLFENFLTCPVCLETFNNPVSLGCNHSFCSECLQSYWKQNSCRKCPICRRKSSKELVIVNFALKELAVSFKQKAKVEEVECNKHPDEIRLFCLDDCRTLCPICEFSGHSQHSVVEVEKAMSEIHEMLHKKLKLLRKKTEIVEKVKRSYDEIQKHSAKQMEHCEGQIRAEFNKLYQFLKKEEESKMDDLRKEQRRQYIVVSKEMEKLQEQLDVLNKSISTIEEHVSSLEQISKQKLSKNSIHLLKEYSQTYSKEHMQESELLMVKMGPGLLINQAKILGNLGFKVWDKMRTLVHFSPVILDPNTMSEKLCLSADLTRVKHTPDPQEKLPENPERFLNEEMVLGAEGFGHGTLRSWIVEVGDCPRFVPLFIDRIIVNAAKMPLLFLVSNNLLRQDTRN